MTTGPLPLTMRSGAAASASLAADGGSAARRPERERHDALYLGVPSHGSEQQGCYTGASEPLRRDSGKREHHEDARDYGHGPPGQSAEVIRSLGEPEPDAERDAGYAGQRHSTCLAHRWLTTRAQAS